MRLLLEGFASQDDGLGRLARDLLALRRHGVDIRARQNVVHEIGFFQGKYGRSRVVLLAEQGVEIFTNISGIVRIDF